MPEMGPQYKCILCGHFMYVAEYARKERCNGCGDEDDDNMEEVFDDDES